MLDQSGSLYVGEGGENEGSREEGGREEGGKRGNIQISSSYMWQSQVENEQ